MKKGISILLVMLLVLSFGLSGCGSDDSPAPEANGEENGEETVQEPADDGEVIEVTFSHNQPTDSPEHVGALKLKEVLEAETDGRVHVEIYPASQMGSLREQVESTQMGVIDLTMQPTAVITPFVDDIKAIDLPYLLPQEREVVFEVLDGELGIELLERLEEGDFHGLGYWFGGYKLFTTKDTEIHEPSDFSDIVMRTMESSLLISQYETWGGTAIPVPYAEVYNSLQQGVVDGQENPIQTIYLNNYHEVQDVIVQSYHGTMTYVLMANKPWFDNLPADIQEAVVVAERAGREAAREAYAEQEQEYIDLIIDSGVNYYELTDEEIEVFREASIPVHEDHYNTEWQQDYLQRLYAAFEEAMN